MNQEIAGKKPKKKFSIQTWLKKNFKFIIAGLIAIIIFNKYIILIVLMIVLGYVGLVSMKLAKLVPHIQVETVNASAILIGYAWGWELGFLFGVIVGIVGFVNASQIKLTTIIAALFMGLSGVLAELFFSMGINFFVSFSIIQFIRGVITYPIFSTIGGDPIESAIHSIFDPLFNIFVYSQLMNLIYVLLRGLGVI